MSDKNPPPWSRRAGRGLRRILGRLLGEKNVRRAGESTEVLKREFKTGRQQPPEEQAKDGDAPKKEIPHREIDGSDREKPPSHPAPKKV